MGWTDWLLVIICGLLVFAVSALAGWILGSYLEERKM